MDPNDDDTQDEVDTQSEGDTCVPILAMEKEAGGEDEAPAGELSYLVSASGPDVLLSTY